MTSATLFTLWWTQQVLLNNQRKQTFSRPGSDRDALSSALTSFFFFFSTFPGRWAARWWWTPTPFAGRRSAWPASRPSCASLSRRSSGRWRKGPGWAWGSANTSLGTADGTARATTSILEKYCNKVRDEKMEHFTCWYLGVSCCIFPQF